MRRALAVCLTCAIVLSGARAGAQAVNADAWSQGVYRPFMSATLDFGFLYLRPRVAFGWGRPHANWVGAELNPTFSTFSTSSVGGYAGLRAAFPFLEARVGARGAYLFDHGYLPNQPSYTLLDFNEASGNATYLTYETEIRSIFRVGPGDVGILASLSSVTGVPAGHSVYDDTLHVIIRPPAVWRTRVGYTFFIPTRIGRFSITPIVDVLGNPSRGAAMLRAGFLATYLINKHLEVRGAFLPSILSPDGLGIALGGDFTELGLRYRWATGD